MADLNYDSIAESYGEDWCGLRGQSRDLVVNQVAGHFERVETSLDCAIGHGEFWTDLAQQTPVVACVGNDLSPEMLVAAQARLEGTHFEGVTGDALTLSERLAGKTFDLVVSHLLYDYCAIETFIPSLKLLLSQTGLISSLTTVKTQYDESFWEQMEARPFLRRLGKVDKSIEEGGTPDSHQDHINQLEGVGLEVVDAQELVVPVAVYSSADIWSAAYHSGWGLGSLSKFGEGRRWALRQALRLTDLPGAGLFPFKMNVRFSSVCARHR